METTGAEFATLRRELSYQQRKIAVQARRLTKQQTEIEELSKCVKMLMAVEGGGG